jgi:hypothetical protein
MEEVISRFPHIAEKFFEELDNYHFIQCKLVSKLWKNFMEESKFSYVRLIETTTKCPKGALKKIYLKATLKETIESASDVSKTSWI